MWINPRFGPDLGIIAVVNPRGVDAVALSTDADRHEDRILISTHEVCPPVPEVGGPWPGATGTTGGAGQSHSGPDGCDSLTRRAGRKTARPARSPRRRGLLREF